MPAGLKACWFDGPKPIFIYFLFCKVIDLITSLADWIFLLFQRIHLNGVNELIECLKSGYSVL